MIKRSLFVLLVAGISWSPLVAMQKSTWVGREYDQNSVSQLDAGKKLIAQIPFEGNESVLDLGCGTCLLAEIIAKDKVPNGKVIAVDYSQSMIDAAQEKYSDKDKDEYISNLTIIQKDATQLDFDQDFDRVISCMCIHWVPTLEEMVALMQGVANSLKPGGIFAAVFTMKHTEEFPIPVMCFAKELVQSERWASFFEGKMVLGNNLSIHDYQEALKVAGLVGKAQVISRTVPNLTKQQIIGNISALPIVKAIPNDHKQEFIEAFLDYFASQGFVDENGLYTITSAAGMIMAQKPV